MTGLWGVVWAWKPSPEQEFAALLEEAERMVGRWVGSDLSKSTAPVVEVGEDGSDLPVVQEGRGAGPLFWLTFDEPTDERPYAEGYTVAADLAGPLLEVDARMRERLAKPEIEPAEVGAILRLWWKVDPGAVRAYLAEPGRLAGGLIEPPEDEADTEEVARVEGARGDLAHHRPGRP